MRDLFILANPKKWTLEVPGVELVRARDYLVDPRYGAARDTRVYNLCRTAAYQGLGYYVSLLADGRGHRPLPSVATLQDLRDDGLRRVVADEVADLANRCLRRLKADTFLLSIYFGRNVSSHYEDLARAIFNRLPAPLLRARFERKDGQWSLTNVRGVGLSEVPESHRATLAAEARRHFARKQGPRRVPSFRFDLAILTNPDEKDAPSDKGALDRFLSAARKEGLDAEVIHKNDRGRIAEFDALFVRETTYVNHHTYRIARRAEAEGLVVVDDPTSILRATNKVYLAEAFKRRRIPHPRTLILDADNAAEHAEQLGYPVVLKRPDSSFSAGVVKAHDRGELEHHLSHFLGLSELVIAQAWTPSSFDWRIGVLGKQPIFAARYGMAPGHWQIQRVDGAGKRHYGTVDSIAVEDAPPAAVKAALRAAAVVGEGLYGVDVKEIDGRFLVMEVNDNPNIDHGGEDSVLGDELYRRIMRWFVARLERRGRRGR